MTGAPRLAEILASLGVATDLAAGLDVEFVELDAIFHQAAWTELSDDEFRAKVRDAVAADGWVVDGNYAVVRPIVLERATTVVWLDYSRPRVMQQVIRRSVERASRRLARFAHATSRTRLKAPITVPIARPRRSATVRYVRST